ncbi:MAG: hypothetical protein V1787_00510 [Candidatus Micrarchaeota archaeon]
MEDIIASAGDAFRLAIDKSANSLFDNVIQLVPGLLGAFLILFVGWVFATIISHIAKKLLDFIRFEKMLAKYGVDDALGSIKLQPVLVKLIKYYILLLFLQAAMTLLYLGTLSHFLTMVVGYAPVFIGAILIVILSAVVGEIAKEKILALGPKSKIARFFSQFTKAVVIFLGVVTGLATMGFDTTIITASFLTILQGLVYGIALAIGIAFGFGGQDDAKAAIRATREKFHL